MLVHTRDSERSPRRPLRGLFFAFSGMLAAATLIACGGSSSSSTKAPAADGGSGGGDSALTAKTAAGHSVCPPSEASKDLIGAGSSAVFPLVSKWVDDSQKQCSVKLN